MPINLKLEFGDNDSPLSGSVFMRPSHHSTGEEQPWQEVPVTRLVLDMAAQEVPTVTATFMCWTAEALVAVAGLADPSAFTQYCFYCHEKMVRTAYERKDGTMVACWACGCDPATITGGTSEQ